MSVQAFNKLRNVVAVECSAVSVRKWQNLPRVELRKYVDLSASRGLRPPQLFLVEYNNHNDTEAKPEYVYPNDEGENERLGTGSTITKQGHNLTLSFQNYSTTCGC